MTQNFLDRENQSCIVYPNSPSTMARKRNLEPGKWQHGLAKPVRVKATAMMDIAKPEERDAMPIGPEMTFISHRCGYADAALNPAVRIFGGLVVHAEPDRSMRFGRTARNFGRRIDCLFGRGLQRRASAANRQKNPNDRVPSIG
jgi:hypothetical protein